MKTLILIGLIAFTFWTQNVEGQQAKQSMKLGAYYFAGWSGTNQFDDGKPGHEWAKGMPSHYTKKMATEFAGREPIWGWRDDTQELMERQIDLAADHGLSYFSFCWYWADNKGPINLEKIEKDSKHLPMRLFMNAKNNNRMEFSIMVANHSGFEIVGEEAWRQAADYWITVFKHPSYLKMDGKPVIVIISPRNADVKGLAYLQEAALKAGFPGVNITCSGSGRPEDGFALRTHYNMIPGYGKPSEKHTYQELFEYHVQHWKGSKEQPYIPCLSVGWDRRPWEAPDGFGNGVEPSWYFEGKTPEAFGKNLAKMKVWMDEHPDQITKDRLAILYAWNEIGEGGWLVPTKEDPDGAYLRVLKSVVFGK